MSEKVFEIFAKQELPKNNKIFRLEQKFLQQLELVQTQEQYQQLTDAWQESNTNDSDCQGIKLALQGYGIQHGFIENKTKKSAVEASMDFYQPAMEKHQSVAAMYLGGLMYYGEYQKTHNNKKTFQKAIDYLARAAQQDHRESMVKLSEIELTQDKSAKEPITLSALNNIPKNTQGAIRRLIQAINWGSDKAFDVLFQNVHPSILLTFAAHQNETSFGFFMGQRHFYYGDGKVVYDNCWQIIDKGEEKKIPEAIYCQAIRFHRCPTDIKLNIETFSKAIQVNNLNLAAEGITYLETYAKNNELGQENNNLASYKLFLLHYLGLGSIQQSEENNKKALNYFNSGFIWKTPKPGILQLLVNDLRVRVNHLQELKAKEQVFDDLAWQHTKTLVFFAQTQDCSKEPEQLQKFIANMSMSMVELGLYKDQKNAEAIKEAIEKEKANTNQSVSAVTTTTTTTATPTQTTGVQGILNGQQPSVVSPTRQQQQQQHVITSSPAMESLNILQ